MFLTRPPLLLRAEWPVATLLAILLYNQLGTSWWLFALLVLAPDLSALGYLVNVRIGAAAYNAAHTTILPVLLAAIGVLADREWMIAVALIWLIHIAVDRAVGYGLKLPTGFKDIYET